MTAEQRRFYDYIERKRANAEPLSWAERAMIRRLIAVRRWPEAPRPNKFWAGYMRYLRSLPNDDLNTAQTLLLTELTRRGLVVMDRDTNQAVTRLREFLNSGQFEPRNWFEQAFGRAEGWMRGWLDYQLASHGHPLGTPGGDDEFPLQAFGEYRLDYSISGCSLEPHGKYSYRGTFSPGKPVTIRGRVRVGGVDGGRLYAYAQCHQEQLFYEQEDVTDVTFPPRETFSWYPFEASIVTTDDTSKVRIGVELKWQPEAHRSHFPRSLYTYADLKAEEDGDAGSSDDEAWDQYVNDTLAKLGYSAGPLARELQRMRDALAGSDADWKRYVDEEQRRLGYDDSPQAVAYYELREAARAGGDQWAGYVEENAGEQPVTGDGDPGPAQATPLTDGAALETLAGNGWLHDDPGEDAQWKQDGSDGSMTIGAPPGNHLHRDHNYDAPRQLVRVEGDFIMEARIRANPSSLTTGAGLWVFGPERTMVRLDRVCAGDRQVVGLAAYDDSGQRTALEIADFAATDLHLRIRRTGDVFEGWFRAADADSWTRIGAVSSSMPTQCRPGIGVINQSDARWFEAAFSEFRIAVGEARG